MKISAVIPNYNGRKVLKKNLASVLKAKGIDEVIVVDDASTDGSVEMLKSDFEKVKLLERAKQCGFSSSVNLGVKNARGDFVVLLNHDVTPDGDFISKAIKHFSDPSVFAVGCLEKSIEDGGIALRGRGIGTFGRGFLAHERGEVDSNHTLWVSGGSAVFRKEIWEKLAGMNTLYDPFYWEDIDLSYRAQKSGYKVVFEAESIVWHKHKEGSIRRHYHEYSIKKIAYRNQILFIWLNITDRYYLINHFIYLPYYLMKSFVTGDFAFVQGFIGALVLLPSVIRGRKQNLKHFIKSDREIISKTHI